MKGRKMGRKIVREEEWGERRRKTPDRSKDVE
jgi:hypothetical protein